MIVIGYGTGRCGTSSLASFLNNQKDFNITHEQASNIYWEPSFSNIDSAIEELKKRNGIIVGDIGYYWIHHINYLLTNYDVKVINIIRNDDETIESFWNNKTNCPAVINGKQWFKYPFDDNVQSKEALESSIRKYRITEELVNMYHKSKIYRMDMTDLNDKHKLNHLLDWLGVIDKNLDTFHLNKSN